jgi:hypothetical protein
LAEAAGGDAFDAAAVGNAPSYNETLDCQLQSAETSYDAIPKGKRQV